MNKLLLRKELREKRNNIPDETRQLAALAAAKIFVNHPLFHCSQHIAYYLALENEFDCTPLLKSSWQALKNTYVPIMPTSGKELKFVNYTEDTSIHKNRFNILEPCSTVENFPKEKLDVVVMPTLGFDLKGNRVGTGGGFYDATFEFLKTKSNNHKPKLIGLAYDIQEVKCYPDEWDVSLDGLLTETHLILFS